MNALRRDSSSGAAAAAAVSKADVEAALASVQAFQRGQ